MDLKPGDLVRRVDIKGRKVFRVSHTDPNSGWIYARQVGGSGGLVTFVSRHMLRRVDGGRGVAAKKSPAQLDREIEVMTIGKPTKKDLPALKAAMARLRRESKRRGADLKIYGRDDAAQRLYDDVNEEIVRLNRTIVDLEG